MGGIVMMRKLSGLLLLMSFLGMYSCQSTGDMFQSVSEMSFTASVGADVKTVLVDGTKVYWENGDRIAVSGASSAFETSLEQAAPVAVFKGQAETADRYFAVYPFSCVREWADELALVELPQVQQARKDSFDPATGITASVTDAESMKFQFHNVVGYLKFTVGSGSGDITSVTVSSNAQEALSGPFFVDCSSLETVADTESSASVSLVSDAALEDGAYYIAMIPGTYSDGLTFTFEGPEGTVMKKISAYGVSSKR